MRQNQICVILSNLLEMVQKLCMQACLHWNQEGVSKAPVWNDDTEYETGPVAALHSRTDS